MKVQLPRKDFELYLLDLRTKVLRDNLPNLAERQIALMAKKWVKAKMRQIDGEVIEFDFNVPEASAPKPLNRWQAFKDKHFPMWLKRFSPVEYHPA